MIKIIRKLLGFKQCMGCHEWRLKLHKCLFNKKVIYCGFCRDSEWEFEVQQRNPFFQYDKKGGKECLAQKKQTKKQKK